ncbi:hypothetical protein [Pseudonocardia kunmingensis]|uniref:Uncharacterized protein n=1 Tax=Pseudonocardia kunmingensis TaxID=630975 RepID=A0A543CX79_9PSEU|nr:hypothetical protein [Pseudonocardia kunmingensis]TQM01700.1 hypothetical protein FB558_8601 [Pseudonocardia kunmingensis]
MITVLYLHEGATDVPRHRGQRLRALARAASQRHRLTIGLQRDSILRHRLEIHLDPHVLALVGSRAAVRACLAVLVELPPDRSPRQIAMALAEHARPVRGWST